MTLELSVGGFIIVVRVYSQSRPEQYVRCRSRSVPCRSRHLCGTCEPAQRDDGGGVDEGVAGGEGRLEVLCRPPIAADPGAGAFDHPAACVDGEADLALGDLCGTRLVRADCWEAWWGWRVAGAAARFAALTGPARTHFARQARRSPQRQDSPWSPSSAQTAAPNQLSVRARVAISCMSEPSPPGR